MCLFEYHSMASSNRQREQDNGSDELETANESQEESSIEISSQISSHDSYHTADQDSSINAPRGRSEDNITSVHTRYYTRTIFFK